MDIVSAANALGFVYWQGDFLTVRMKIEFLTSTCGFYRPTGMPHTRGRSGFPVVMAAQVRYARYKSDNSLFELDMGFGREQDKQKPRHSIYLSASYVNMMVRPVQLRSEK